MSRMLSGFWVVGIYAGGWKTEMLFQYEKSVLPGTGAWSMKTRSLWILFRELQNLF